MPELTKNQVRVMDDADIADRLRRAADMERGHIGITYEHGVDLVNIVAVHGYRLADGLLAVEALSQALRQWKMYAEMQEERDLLTEVSPEAEMYRAALAVAERR